MARDLKLDTFNDLAIEDGDLQIVEDGTEVAQSWRLRLLWLLGEWYYNPGLGMPWFSAVFKQTFSPMYKRQLIFDCTLGTQGVTAIKSFEEIVDGRTGTLNIRIATKYNTEESVVL